MTLHKPKPKFGWTTDVATTNVYDPEVYGGKWCVGQMVELTRGQIGGAQGRVLSDQGSWPNYVRLVITRESPKYAGPPGRMGFGKVGYEDGWPPDLLKAL